MTSFEYFRVALLILIVCIYAVAVLQLVGLVLYSAFRRRVKEWLYCMVAFGVATALTMTVALLAMQ